MNGKSLELIALTHDFERISKELAEQLRNIELEQDTPELSTLQFFDEYDGPPHDMITAFNDTEPEDTSPDPLEGMLDIPGVIRYNQPDSTDDTVIEFNETDTDEEFDPVYEDETPPELIYKLLNESYLNVILKQQEVITALESKLEELCKP